TSVESTGAPVLVVSQFTLYGRTAKGRRPSWSDAAPGPAAEPVINKVIEQLRARNIHVEEGRFGAMMKVASVNDGPCTVLVVSETTRAIYPYHGSFCRLLITVYCLQEKVSRFPCWTLCNQQ